MEKIKACLTKSLAHKEPSDAEIAEAVMEALDVIASIASALNRIADAAERQVQPMHGITDHRTTPANR